MQGKATKSRHRVIASNITRKYCIVLILFLENVSVNYWKLHFCKEEKSNINTNLLVRTGRIDIAQYFEYPCQRPGRPGAAEPAEPRQGRKTATVRKCLWVPPVTCLDIFSHEIKPLGIRHHRIDSRRWNGSRLWVVHRPG